MCLATNIRRENVELSFNPLFDEQHEFTRNHVGNLDFGKRRSRKSELKGGYLLSHLFLGGDDLRGTLGALFTFVISLLEVYTCLQSSFRVSDSSRFCDYFSVPFCRKEFHRGIEVLQ